MDPFLGEIRLFAGPYEPLDWAFCDGRLLSISQYNALFSLLGTTYGGDGTSTFALPDLRGRVPIGRTAAYPIGVAGGREQVTLQAGELPAHSHMLTATTTKATATSPASAYLADTDAISLYKEAAPSVELSAATLDPFGAAAPEPHDNMQPFGCLQYMISLAGVYPTWS